MKVPEILLSGDFKKIEISERRKSNGKNKNEKTRFIKRLIMENLEKIVETLRIGGTILYPTDTIWGLGCDATNEDACQKLLAIKRRPESKSFIILVDSFQMLEKYVPEFSNVCYELAELAIRPLTIIYPKAEGLASSVLAEDGSVGIRLTKDPTCLKIIKALKKPIVSKTPLTFQVNLIQLVSTIFLLI